MEFMEEYSERIQVFALQQSARNLRHSAELCLEESNRLRRALTAYRELLNDDVSDHVAEVIAAVNHRFGQINAAYANAYTQLGAAAELLTEYEQLGQQ